MLFLFGHRLGIHGKIGGSTRRRQTCASEARPSPHDNQKAKPPMHHPGRLNANVTAQPGQPPPKRCPTTSVKHDRAARRPTRRNAVLAHQQRGRWSARFNLVAGEKVHIPVSQTRADTARKDRHTSTSVVAGRPNYNRRVHIRALLDKADPAEAKQYTSWTKEQADRTTTEGYTSKSRDLADPAEAE